MTERVARLGETDWRMFAGMRLRALADSLGETDPSYRDESAFTAAQWRRRLREHAQFAVLDDDRPVGLIGAQQENTETVYLYSLWLDPRARGRGLARRLVETAVAWARTSQVRTVRLRVATHNVAAREVYESLGFTVADDQTSCKHEELAMSLSVS